jgi:hypothetical protein
MRKIVLFLLILILALGNAPLYAAITPVEDKSEWRAQVYIVNWIKGIGVVDSYQEDSIDKSYVYDNALAAIACLALSNYTLAKEVLDTLANEAQKNTDGVPFESYNYSDLNGAGSGAAFAGNIAWLLQAMNIYQARTQSKWYYITQKKLADFLLSLQDGRDGGIRGSRSDYWKSAENNIVAYVALYNFGILNKQGIYIAQANRVKKFLASSAVWDGTRFNRGPSDTTKVTDVQALGVLALGRQYASALTWAEQNLKLTLSYNSQTVTGFDFNGDLDTVWLEGTLQMAAAFYSFGNTSKADYYYNEAVKTLQSDGALLLATNTGTASDYWILQPWRAIAPTAWLILYRLRFNPLLLYLWPKGNPYH